MIDVYCAACGALYHVPKEREGVRFRCKNCSRSVVYTDKVRRVTVAPKRGQSAAADDDQPTASTIKMSSADEITITTFDNQTTVSGANGVSQYPEVSAGKISGALEETQIETLSPESPAVDAVVNKQQPVVSAILASETTVSSKSANDPNESEIEEADTRLYDISGRLADRIIKFKSDQTQLFPGVELDRYRREQKEDGLVEW